VPIRGRNGVFAFVRLELSLSEIPHLLAKHRRKYPGGPKLERQGRALVGAAFAQRDAVRYVEAVCRWGRGQRFVGRVLSDNAHEDIQQTLREAYALACMGNAALGVERITSIVYLGQSFASKQLRFLAPSRAVILDEVIRSSLGYAQSIDGYEQFLGDCQSILARARTCRQLQTGIKAALRVCDVEAAVFAKLKGY
jgi:hypothetical protein